MRLKMKAGKLIGQTIQKLPIKVLKMLIIHINIRENQKETQIKRKKKKTHKKKLKDQ